MDEYLFAMPGLKIISTGASDWHRSMGIKSLRDMWSTIMQNPQHAAPAVASKPVAMLLAVIVLYTLPYSKWSTWNLHIFHASCMFQYISCMKVNFMHVSCMEATFMHVSCMKHAWFKTLALPCIKHAWQVYHGTMHAWNMHEVSHITSYWLEAAAL